MKTYKRTTFLLLFLTICAFALLAFARVSNAGEVSITLQWDADTAGGWEFVNIYERTEGGAYDYANPVGEVAQTYDAEGKSQPVIFKRTLTAADGEKTTFYWVARAKAGDLESADSEEASYTVDLAVIPAPAYTAAFNETSMSIDFSWPTDADPRITSWRIFTKLPAETEWTELAQVDASGSTSVPIGDLFPDGEKTTREFTMVAYGPFGLYSQNGLVTTIDVNRKPPSGVINFKIKLVE